MIGRPFTIYVFLELSGTDIPYCGTPQLVVVTIPSGLSSRTSLLAYGRSATSLERKIQVP